MKTQTFESIDDYISGFPDEISVLLNQIRDCIHNTAPNAIESINYNMPAFKVGDTILVYFSAFKNHIGFYALPNVNVAFKQELSTYKTGKGSIQFPLDKTLPLKLIIKLVQFRMSEIMESQRIPKT